MKVAVIGTGYVGVTTAISFAIKGHEVTCIDIDQRKIEQLQNGILPIYEPEMDQAFLNVQGRHPIQFTSSLKEAAKDAKVFFLCVGTPSDRTGKADLTYVYQAVEELKQHIPTDSVERAIVLKSTVPIGTATRVASLLAERQELMVISNPEFLREGNALYDSLHPSRIVIGTASPEAKEIMNEVYAGFQSPVVYTTWNNAEMIKYASNAFLATKISFINELARLCDRVEADITVVADGMGLDKRIGRDFLYAGIGFGGSCFPKDTAALVSVARENGIELSIIQKTIDINRTQAEWFLGKLRHKYPDVSGKRIALLGLSFKPDTDDIREAPSLAVMKLLLDAGATIVAYDPVAAPNVKRVFPMIQYVDSPYAAIDQADAAILLTEWDEVVSLDWPRVYDLMNVPYLLDGRNTWPQHEVRKLGFSYSGVGR